MLHLRVLRGKLPVHFCIEIVTMDLPGRHSTVDLIDSVDPTIQALVNEHVKFNLRHIKPASMFGSIDTQGGPELSPSSFLL